MRGALILMLALTCVPSPSIAGRSGFDPAYEALVVINIAAPERVRTAALLSIDRVDACIGPRTTEAEILFDELDSRLLAGRAPRLGSFTLEPGLLDSLVIHWGNIEVRVSEAWIRPPSAKQSSVISLSRRVVAGEVLVLNLLWRPDAQSADAMDWHPVLELEELVEPPLGARMYVSEEGTGIVAVLERRSGRMVRGLPVGGQPRDLAWDPLRHRLYVATAGRDELVSIDLSGPPALDRLPLSFGADPTRVLLSRDRDRIAVLAPGRDMVFLFSASSLQEIARIRVGQGAVGITEAVRDRRLFVSSRLDGRVDVIDPEALRVVDRFGGFDSPGEILALQSGLIALAQESGRRIEFLDPATGVVQSAIDLCGPVRGLASAARVDRLFGLIPLCSEVTILRAAAGLEIGRIGLEEPAGLISLGPREAELFIPLPDSRRILLMPVDRAGDRRYFEVGSGPWRAVAP